LTARIATDGAFGRAVLGLLGCGLALAPTPGRAHGSLEVPISRVYNCFKEGPEAPKSDACAAVVAAGGTQPLYDWMEVNQFEANGRHRAIVPDGTLCAGGREKYVGLDLRRRDWPTTTIAPDANGRFKFVYYAMTPHATKYFRFYVTRDDWKPTKPLAWSDLQLFGTVRAPEARDSRYTMNLKLPAEATGRRLIYVVWQRSDSAEAFYSCSDVKILKASASPAPAAAVAAWSEAGRAIARNDLKPGSTVSFRVFGADGSDVERHVLAVTARTGDATAWPYALARKVNEASEIFKIGVLDEGRGGAATIVPVESAAANRVYLSGDHAGFTYQIDIDTP